MNFDFLGLLTKAKALAPELLHVAKLTWKKLLMVFIVASIVCGLVGMFIPFVSVRSFGFGGGFVCTAIALWFFYTTLKKANVQ